MAATELGNPKRIEGLVIDQGEKALALSHPETNRTVLTNRVGRQILELADGTLPLAAVVDRLAARYPGVARETLARQVEAFVEDGVRKGILVWWRPPAARQGLGSLPVLSEKAGAAPALDALDEAREKERKFHPDIYWYLTFRCNLACAHCSVLSSPWVDTSGDLGTDDCLRVVEQMAEMNVATAILSGGEVLIRPDAVTVLRALSHAGIYVGLETNGLRFDREFIAVAAELQAKRKLSMTISLDGGTRETHEVLRGRHSFDRTVRGMRLLKEHGIHFDVQCVLHTDNIESIPQLYDLAIELSPECECVLWAPLNDVGRGGELIKTLGLRYEHTLRILELISEHKSRFSGIHLIKFPPAMVPPRYLMEVYKDKMVGCSTSCKFPLLGVLPNGDITVCALSRRQDHLYFGNIRETRLKDAWEQARMDLLRERYTAAAELQGICGDCVWKQACKGSCRARAYEEGEDFFAPFPVCQDAADRGVFPDVYRISKRGQAPLPYLPGQGLPAATMERST